MGMFFKAKCSLCWDPEEYCTCTTEAKEAYEAKQRQLADEKKRETINRIMKYDPRFGLSCHMAVETTSYRNLRGLSPLTNYFWIEDRLKKESLENLLDFEKLLKESDIEII